MKALVKDYMGEQLVYIPVKYKNGLFWDDHENKIHYSNILDISRDNRKNTLVCGGCGELIKNTPEAIEKHWKDKAKEKNCLTCKHMREHYDRNFIKKTIKPDPNNPNKYIVTTKSSSSLYCSYSWREPKINTEDADRYCMFYVCKNATRDSFTDFFLQYPHAFEMLPTVDALIQKKWKLHNTTNGYLFYTHPKMTSLEANVNSKGIVTEFKIDRVYKSNSARFMYSKKYDKVICIENSRYNATGPWYIQNNEKMQSVIQKVKELF